MVTSRRDEESACSAHDFDPSDRNGDYLVVVRLRGGADNGNHDDPDKNYDGICYRHYRLQRILIFDG